ncbi:MAG: ABC transporter permease [Solirubrobacteraceae bacterium]
MIPTLANTRTLAIRAGRLSLRNLESLITALVLPVILMLMFVYLFGGAIRTGSAHYIDFVVPGVLLVCAGFGATSTAVNVATDLTTGIIDRLRSLDVGGPSLLGGHVTASVVRNLLSTAVVFALAFAIGYRSPASLLDWLAAIAILALFVLALSWVAALLGILAGSPEAANGLAFPVMFLAYPSSAFVPVATMPAGLRTFAQNQPETQVIDTIRALLSGTPVGSHALLAIAWSLAIIASSLVLARILFQQRVK